MANNPKLFFLWAPDHTDEGAPERRRAVRPTHIEGVHKNVKGGIIRVGGGFLTADSVLEPVSDRKYAGSCLIIEAESLHAAREFVESDVHYTSGVWDKEKLQILPITLAHPLPKIPPY